MRKLELKCYSGDDYRLALEAIAYEGTSIEVVMYDNSNNANLFNLSKDDAKKLRKTLKKFIKGEL